MLAANEQWLLNSIYAPKLPWKKGEIAAFTSASNQINNRTTPIFVIPPAGAFDHDEMRILAPADHIRIFGARLRDARKDRPVFVDAVYLDDERHRSAFNVHPLTALLERARISRATAWPITSYDRSDDYQKAVAKARILHDSPVGIQIRLADLGSASLARKLQNLSSQISCAPKNAVLIVDCGPLFFADETREDEFAEGLIQALNNLPSLHEWCQIVLTATSLGEVQKTKPNQQKLIRRSEWHIYRQLIIRRRELLRCPIFADYGTDYRENLAPIKARPSAKLHYTTDTLHFCVKGENVSTGGYEAIFKVAETVAKSDHFMGPMFSHGDARILLLSQQLSSTGNAPTWKWICADHHLAVVMKGLYELHGLTTVQEKEAPAVQQIEMFSLSSVE